MRTGIGFFSSNTYDIVRPDYDIDSISKVLQMEFDAKKNYTASEIAAGSGKFTSLLIKSLNFNVLSIVEPEKSAINVHKEKFHNSNITMNYINDYSDSTHLKEHSQDCIFISQAFHFFPIKSTREEFLRILKPEGKVFIFARFLCSEHEASKRFISLTRFGKRLNGYKNNIQAYDEQNITDFFGKRVQKKIITNEYLSYSKDQLIENVKIRIQASGDESLINDIKQQNRIITSINEFYNQYKDEKEKVNLKYQSFCFCSDLGHDII